MRLRYTISAFFSSLLETLQSWDAQPVGAVSISDDKIALSTWCNHIGCEREQRKLEIRGLSTDWTTIGPGDSEPSFVNADMLFVRPLPTEQGSPAMLAGTNGQVVFKENQPLPGGIRWQAPVRSAEGNRFVVPGSRVEGAHPTLDIGGHAVLKTLLVYDLSSNQHYVLDVKGPKIKGEMKFALSPDGSRLAVLNNETVEVFDLPPVQ